MVGRDVAGDAIEPGANRRAGWPVALDAPGGGREHLRGDVFGRLDFTGAHVGEAVHPLVVLVEKVLPGVGIEVFQPGDWVAGRRASNRDGRSGFGQRNHFLGFNPQNAHESYAL